MPVTLATLDAEIRRIEVQSQPRQIVCEINEEEVFRLMILEVSVLLLGAWGGTVHHGEST
jgi:hypothetical protein